MYVVVALGVASFSFALLLTPFVRNLFIRIGVVDLPDNRKRHPRAIPRLGGVAIWGAYILAFAVVATLPFHDAAVIRASIFESWKLLLAASLVFTTGLLDDVINLKPHEKLLGQIWASVLAYSAGVRIGFPDYALDVLWSLPLTIVWLVGCTNAFNLIDGMDGLATGAGLFAALTMLVAALSGNNIPLAVVTVPLVGALLGFLRYNFNPASIFLGDSGSLFIGFLLGCFGVLWSQKAATLLGLTAPLMALSIPLLDMTLSIIRRFLRHQPIFNADRGHIHHRLLDRGLTTRRAALLIYAVCAIAATASFLQSALDRNELGGIVVLLFAIGTWVGIQHLGYSEFGMARQMIMKGDFRRIIDSQTKLQELERQFEDVQSAQQCWALICYAATTFGAVSVRARFLGCSFAEEYACELEGSVWHMQVSFSIDEYLQVSYQPQFAPTPLITGPFLAVVERAVRQCIDRLSKDTMHVQTVTCMQVQQTATRAGFMV